MDVAQQHLTSIDQQALSELKDIMGEDFPVLLKTFFDDSSRKFDELHQAIEARNYEELRLLAHSFKGSSSNLYAAGLKQLCYQLEQTAIAEKLDDAKGLVERIRDEFNSVKSQLEMLA